MDAGLLVVPRYTVPVHGTSEAQRQILTCRKAGVGLEIEYSISNTDPSQIQSVLLRLLNCPLKLSLISTYLISYVLSSRHCMCLLVSVSSKSSVLLESAEAASSFEVLVFLCVHGFQHELQQIVRRCTGSCN